MGNSASIEAQAGSPRVTRYYYAAGQRVAMRRDGAVYYLHADHLGSTSLATDAGGGVHSRQLYHPFGSVRWSDGTLPTDFTYTGQRADASTGLMYYRTRYYNAALGRFISADTVVPNPGNPQDLNRYSYVRNSPLVYLDPSGHDPQFPMIDGVCSSGACLDDPGLLGRGGLLELVGEGWGYQVWSYQLVPESGSEPAKCLYFPHKSVNRGHGTVVTWAWLPPVTAHEGNPMVHPFVYFVTRGNLNVRSPCITRWPEEFDPWPISLLEQGERLTLRSYQAEEYGVPFNQLPNPDNELDVLIQVMQEAQFRGEIDRQFLAFHHPHASLAWIACASSDFPESWGGRDEAGDYTRAWALDVSPRGFYMPEAEGLPWWQMP